MSKEQGEERGKEKEKEVLVKAVEALFWFRLKEEEGKVKEVIELS